MLFTGLGRSVLGKTVPSVSSAASGRTRDRGHSFSQYGPPSRWITYIYFSVCFVVIPSLVTFRNTTYMHMPLWLELQCRHCSKGSQVSILAKVETFECPDKTLCTGKEFLSRIRHLCLLAFPFQQSFFCFFPSFKNLLTSTDILKEMCPSI